MGKILHRYELGCDIVGQGRGCWPRSPDLSSRWSPSDSTSRATRIYEIPGLYQRQFVRTVRLHSSDRSTAQASQRYAIDTGGIRTTETESYDMSQLVECNSLRSMIHQCLSKNYIQM